MSNPSNIAPLSLEATDLNAFWPSLTAELATVFDAHGVSDIVANQLARRFGMSVVVGLTSQLDGFYDVWVCNPPQKARQMRWPSPRSSFGQLLNNATNQLFLKKELSETDLAGSDLWPLVTSTLLAIPLPFQRSFLSQTPPGIICLIDPPAAVLDDEFFVSTLGNQVTTYLDRAYLSQRTVQQDVVFDVVADISNKLTSTLSLERIYSELADPLRRIMNVEAISLGLTEPDTGEIVFISALMGARFKELPAVRLAPGQGIAGWVAEHGEPLIINNVYDDKRFYNKVDSASGFKTGSMLCVPLKVEKRVIGIMQAINKQVGTFNQNDLRILLSIAGPLGAAIENASLHADVLSEKQRIQTIFASMSEGLMTLDIHGRITATNESLETLLFYDDDEHLARGLVGQMASDVIRLREGSFTDFVAEVLMSDGDYPQLACDVYKGNGEVPVLLSGAPIDRDVGDVAEAIIVFSDLSQIREVERMRDDFFHNIVHELRTPLATILMYGRLLRDGKTQGDDDKTARFLDTIVTESDRLQTMVRQALQLAKLEASEIQRSNEPINLLDIFGEILPPLGDRATQKGLTFESNVAKQLAPVQGDRETLYAIFKNLVENAVKFTLEGSVQVTVKQAANFIIVTISDEGIGIPEAAMPNLFRRFYRARTAVEKGIAGTGLGLYMVKEGVEKHGGTLEVESIEAQGTTFIVGLPIAKAGAER